MNAMFRSTRTRRFSSWLALAVFALNAFWPLLANARPADVSWQMELCSSQGMKTIPGGPTSSPADGGAMLLTPHCPLCFFGADRVFAPMAAPLQFVSTAAPASRPQYAVQSAESHGDIFSPAHPRAPPVLS